MIKLILTLVLISICSTSFALGLYTMDGYYFTVIDDNGKPPFKVTQTEIIRKLEETNGSIEWNMIKNMSINSLRQWRIKHPKG